jgi:membrane-associated phospholipid phosphatase
MTYALPSHSRREERRPPRRTRSVGAVVLSLVLVVMANASCSSHRAVSEGSPDTLIAWMNLVAKRVRLDNLNPPQASRVFAYVGVAQYEAVVPAFPGRRSLAKQLNALPVLPKPVPGGDLDFPTAQSAAMLRVLNRHFQSSPASVAAFSAFFDGTLAARRAANVTPTAISNAVEYGSAVGDAIVRWSESDGAGRTGEPRYNQVVAPGTWVPTGDVAAKLKPAEPYWGNLRPFALSSADACAVPPPKVFSTERNSAFFQEPQAVYTASRALTDEQRNVALFWADTPGKTSTPAGHWIELIGQVAAERPLADASEAYALAGIALADAFIACWRDKFVHMLERPETFIREHIDHTWEPLLKTPQFPEYPSGHSVASAAAADVLQAALGKAPYVDRVPERQGYAPRRFESFEQAAREAASSRIYAGIHYPMAVQNGLGQGHCVAGKLLAGVQTRARQLVAPEPAPDEASPSVRQTQLKLAASDSTCSERSDARACMTCCAEHHGDAAARMSGPTRACVCSTANGASTCASQCPNYCSGTPDSRGCYACVFREMKAGAPCFKSALGACTDDDCLDYLSCRAVCTAAPIGY